MNCNFFASLNRKVEAGSFDEKSIATARRMAASEMSVRFMVKSTYWRDEELTVEWDESEDFGGMTVPELFKMVLDESKKSGKDEFFYSGSKESLYYQMAQGINHEDWCFMPDYLQACLESDLWSDGDGNSFLSLFSPLHEQLEIMISEHIESVAKTIQPGTYCLAE